METDVSVVIPAFNEEKAIEKVIKDIEKVLKASEQKYEIIVVDDGSTDETPRILEKIQGIELIAKGQNRGYGSALKTGIKKARSEWVLIIDGDETYPPEDIPRLLENIGEYDMVIGARTGEDVHVPLLRRPGKWFLTRLSEYLTDSRIPDLNSGMRVFKKKDMLELFGILPSGFSFSTTTTLAYISNETSRVKYVPINYRKRKGESKINPFKDGFNFTLLILRVVTYFNPLKVCIPVGVGLMAAAFFVLLISSLFLNRLMDTTVTLLTVGAIQIVLFGLIADAIVRRRIV